MPVNGSVPGETVATFVGCFGVTFAGFLTFAKTLCGVVGYPPDNVEAAANPANTSAAASPARRTATRSIVSPFPFGCDRGRPVLTLVVPTRLVQNSGGRNLRAGARRSFRRGVGR